MASSRKHSRRHPVRTLILCLLAVCIVAGGTAFALLRAKIAKIGQGATFDFSYQITSTSTETPVLYTILEQTEATQGSVTGLYEPGKLLFSIYRLTGETPAASYENGAVVMHPEARTAEPFTRVYVDSTETLYDVGQLYDTIRTAIVNAYSLADAILPAWSLGDYISQAQLSTLLGVETNTVEMQDMTGFTLALGALKPAHPEGALDGWLYFALDNSSAAESAPALVLGIPKDGIFSKSVPLHILLTIPEHGVSAELLGTLTAAETNVLAPESRMQDEDIATFAQIRQTVEQLLDFVRQAAG